MNLRDKFSEHTSEIDPNAWEHFTFLRENKKKKRKGALWFILASGLAVIILLSAVGYTWYAKTQRTDQQLNEQELTEQINKAEQTNIPTLMDQNISNEKNKQLAAVHEQKTEMQNSKTLSIRNLNTTRNSSIETKQNKNTITLSQPNQIANPNNQDLALELIETVNPSNDVRSANDILNNIASPTQSNAYDTNLNATAKTDDSSELPSAAYELSTLTNTLYPNLLTYERFLPINEMQIIKPVKSPLYTLKLTSGFADGFINGFSLENPVQKQGFGIQMEFYRTWGKILGIGVSLGYVQGEDTANPSFEIKDREVIKYLHFNLYLFLVNEQRHRLYGKIGVGPTQTDRILGTFFIDQPNQIIERRFQINTLKSRGLAVEAAYEFQLTPRWLIGANYTIISHNDGGWFSGLSLGYRF